MTHKFKIGDRVTLGGVVAGNSDNGSTYIMIDGGDVATPFTPSEIDFTNYETKRYDTTFRDQAAIAALQGILADKSNPGMAPNTAASLAFNLAEALDAERKKRGEVSDD